MHDARDAEDTRLLEAGEFRLLVEGYVGVIYDRCRLKLRNPQQAEDVAHEVVLRLLRELKRGRRYDVPFRVVVHNVVDWKVKEHFQGMKREPEYEEWMDDDSGAADGTDRVHADAGFELMLEGLTELEATVIRLRYGPEDLDFQEIAVRLDRKPNAIHQIHYRALEKLRRLKLP